jgi:hypothetical protein
MSGWKEKIIFKIPAYAMSIFKILKKYAKNLRVQYHNSGGAMISMIIKCIGLPSGNYAFQKGGGGASVLGSSFFQFSNVSRTTLALIYESKS